MNVRDDAWDEPPYPAPVDWKQPTTAQLSPERDLGRDRPCKNGTFDVGPHRT